MTVRRRLSWERLAASTRWPLVVLAVLSIASGAARAAWLGLPCDRPCTTSSQHRLLFDEHYYVNAARVIAGVPPPPGAQYAGAPRGDDPNSEHPPLAKLIIAGSIRALGDGPTAWRVGSLAMGSLAILGMFALVLAAGGSRWLAVGTAALMATDNLLLVHGRLATLDEYALAPMLWGVALYLRGRPVSAGVLIGVAACMKEVGLYALAVLALVEGLRALNRRRQAGVGPLDWGRAATRRWLACAGSALACALLLLGLLDRIVPPYDPLSHRVVAGGPIGHALHMLHYAAAQTSPHGPRGIASYPWAWLVDLKPIVYSVIGLVNPANRRLVVAPPAHFLGFISPPVLLFALPSLLLALVEIRRGSGRADSVVGAAWMIGCLLPFALLSLIFQRTSYLYYMVIVMPGIYLLVAGLFARSGTPRWALIVWIAAVAVSAVVLYPFTPVPYLS